MILFGAGLWAQEAPKIETAFDYSFARYAPSASYTKGHSLNGGGGALAVNLSDHFGLVMDLQGYNSNTTTFTIPPNTYFPGGGNGSVSGNLFTYLFGPQFKFYAPGVNPFVNVLLGAAHSSVYGNAYKQICQPVAGACAFSGSPNGDAFALAAGGGLDIPINHRVDFRVGEFDYLYTDFTNKFTNSGQNNFRYLAGLNVKMGLPYHQQPNVACNVSPSEVLPWAGPVRATAEPTSFNPKHALTYSWDSSGGKASGEGNAASVDTTSLAPGQYTIKANVTDPKARNMNTATCTAAFTVKEPRPPVVACSASPTLVRPGQPVSITVSGSSPDQSQIDKRSFSASSGALREGETSRGTQPGEFTTTATLDTTNVSPGTISVNVGVTDAHGLSGTCVASATVEAPPAPAVIPARLATQCSFKEGKKTAARVDNQCKASLDSVAIQVKHEPDSRLVIVGFSDTAEASSAPNVEAVRAANVRDYLTKGDGKQQLDPSRIEIRKSTSRNGKLVQVYFVPSNGVIRVDNTDVIDESTLPAKRGSKS
jgi:hypothetical protein